MVYVVCLGSIIFILALCIIIEVSLLNRKIRVKCPALIYLLISSVVIATAAFRYGIGYDFFSYENIFSRVNTNHDISFYNLANILNLEIGYVWLNRVMPSFPILIFVLAISSAGTKLYYIRKFSSYCVLTLMLYYCGIFLNYDMGVLRQGIAISFFFAIIDCLNRNKLLMVVLLTVLSSLFHITSLVYLSVIVIADKKISKRTVYIIIFTVSILAVMSDVSAIIIGLLSRIGLKIVTEKLAYYMLLGGNNNLASYIKRVIYLIIFTEFYQKYKAGKLQRIFYNSYLLSIILMALFSNIGILGGRGVIALSFTQNFLLADMYCKINNSILRLLILALCISTAILSMYNIISFGNISGQNYLPYTTIYDYGLRLL